MPTSFMKKRYARFMELTGGEQTVRYIRYDPHAIDNLTGDADEAKAYDSEAKHLPAWVELNPSEALRKKLGQDIMFDAVLILTTMHLQQQQIELKIGDKFILPEEDDRGYYVRKIAKTDQDKAGYMSVMVAIAAQTGGRQ